ncbi:hypothetical protein [Fodinibius sp. SL11]|uniref:hypothetical protein n=1 Tax=Fodinibius sp. SL11 TaxID=3425690 RepID=UPI003F8827D9
MQQLTKISSLVVLMLMLGIAGCEGPAGEQGPQGTEGPQGPVGPAGDDGSMMYSGQGVPDASTGETGDYYLDTDTGELYGPKDDNGWGNPIIVLKGEDGEDGSQIHAGSGAPDPSLGDLGDFYLDQANYDMYGPKTENGWGSPINLKGADGNANVTVYVFDAPDFTFNGKDTTLTIGNKSYTDMLESSWDLYLVRGGFMHTIPGVIDEGNTGPEFSVSMIHQSSDIEFTITINSGAPYYPDDVRIVQTKATNVVDNTSSAKKNSGESPNINSMEYKELINKYGLDHVQVVDRRQN